MLDLFRKFDMHYFETNGDLSIFTYQDFQDNSNNQGSNGGNTKGAPVDIGGSPTPKNAKTNQQGGEIYPFPLILSGVINYDNLDTLQLTEKWLLKN